MGEDRPGNGQSKNGQRPNGSTGQELHDLERFFPLVNSIARRTLRGELAAFDYGDAVATGLLALVKSERRVGADERGFASYASQRVRGAILDAIRELGCGPVAIVSINAGEGRDGNGHGSPFDIPDGSRYSSPEWVADRRESIQELREAIKLLRPREQQILLLRYWGEETTRSVAQRLGISPARVSQLEKRARQRLRALLTDGNGRSACPVVRRPQPDHLSVATS
jgi:RNA polymerase sigma factor (sigma-70 family)